MAATVLAAAKRGDFDELRRLLQLDKELAKSRVRGVSTDGTSGTKSCREMKLQRLRGSESREFSCFAEQHLLPFLTLYGS